MKSQGMKKVWTPLETEIFYKNLLDKALDTIPEKGAVIVIGPMFVNKNPEENFALFTKKQNDLISQGLDVFDQLPFVDYNLEEAPFNYAVKFELFYKPLIQSGKIKACYLLPDWSLSSGTKTEIEYAREFGIPVYEN